MKCPSCDAVVRVSGGGSWRCPACGVMNEVEEVNGPSIVVEESSEVVGAKYFRTNPPGWHSVDADGSRVAKITKAEAEVIRNAQD